MRVVGHDGKEEISFRRSSRSRGARSSTPISAIKSKQKTPKLDYLSKKKSATADCYNEDASDNEIGNAAATSIGKTQTNSSSILHRRQPHLSNDVNRIVRSLFEEQG